MACVMRELPNAMNVLAPPCGSWSFVSRGTSDRSPINPDGRASTDFVTDGNMTIARRGICSLSACTTVHDSMSRRLVLLMILILAVHGVFILEQPLGSEQVLPFNRRFSWFANKICYVPCQYYTHPETRGHINISWPAQCTCTLEGPGGWATKPSSVQGYGSFCRHGFGVGGQELVHYMSLSI